ncbi:MoaD/ThiS family protein [Candidatus Bathyarchaeota archaeon]|nr:MoaD/ThiS family protein [Candidatus Bathyarchaeota archaeon]
MNPTSRDKVTLKFLGVFKKAYGNSQISLEIKRNEKLGDVIKKISETSQNLRRILIDPELETPLSNTVILVNGVEVHLLKGLDTELKDKDEIVFIPVIHGG